MKFQIDHRIFFVSILILLLEGFVLMEPLYAWGNTGHPERHTLALSCDLESFNDAIRFNMNYREGVIQFDGTINKVPIIKSDSPYGGFDFNMLYTKENNNIACNIVLPSGALMCATNEGGILVGFCLLDSEQ